MAAAADELDGPLRELLEACGIGEDVQLAIGLHPCRSIETFAGLFESVGDVQGRAPSLFGYDVPEEAEDDTTPRIGDAWLQARGLGEEDAPDEVMPDAVEEEAEAEESAEEVVEESVAEVAASEDAADEPAVEEVVEKVVSDDVTADEAMPDAIAEEVEAQDTAVEEVEAEEAVAEPEVPQVAVDKAAAETEAEPTASVSEKAAPADAELESEEPGKAMPAATDEAAPPDAELEPEEPGEPMPAATDEDIAAVDPALMKELKLFGAEPELQAAFGRSPCRDFDSLSTFFESKEDVEARGPEILQYACLRGKHLEEISFVVKHIWSSAVKKVEDRRKAEAKKVQKAAQEAERQVKKEADRLAKEEAATAKAAERAAKKLQKEEENRELKEAQHKIRKEEEERRAGEMHEIKEMQRKAKEEEAVLRAEAKRMQKEAEQKLKMMGMGGMGGAAANPRKPKAVAEGPAAEGAAAPLATEAGEPQTGDGAAGGDQAASGGDASAGDVPRRPGRPAGRPGVAASVKNRCWGNRLGVTRGAVLRLRGLRAQAHLNGREAICLGPSADGTRWRIHVDGAEEDGLMNVQRENVEVVAKSSDCVCGPSLKRLKLLQKESERLKKRLREVEVPTEAVIRGIAELECEPLRQCTGPKERGDWKRKLMLKWHPDKAVSQAHRAIATQVSQEMQTHAEWNAC